MSAKLAQPKPDLPFFCKSHLEPEGCIEDALLAGTLLLEGPGQQLSPTTAPPSPSGFRSKSSSVYNPQLRPIIWMAWGIFAPVCHVC